MYMGRFICIIKISSDVISYFPQYYLHSHTHAYSLETQNLLEYEEITRVKLKCITLLLVFKKK